MDPHGLYECVHQSRDGAAHVGTVGCDIRTCDVYVQPSRYEGKSITVREAQILCKPVIVTHYPTAPSQVQDGVDGVIVPLEREACAEAMIKVIKDEKLLSSLTEYLSEHDYGNESEIEKIYKLCE